MPEDPAPPAAFPVPQKVSCVRWCSALSRREAEVVVAGTHDSDQCCVYFFDINAAKSPSLEPEPLWAAAHHGPVRDLHVTARPDLTTQVVTASAWGVISLYTALWERNALAVKMPLSFSLSAGSASPHPSQRGKSAVNSIAVPASAPGTVIAASAVGTLSVIDLERPDDSVVALTLCPITKVVCRDAASTEVLTLSQRTVALWDTRALVRPAMSCQAAGPHKLTALAVHPTLPGIYATGDLGGGLTLWDLRAGTRAFEARQTPLQPATSLAAVWHVQYAPEGSGLLVGDGAGALDVWRPDPTAPPPLLAKAARLRRGPLPVVSFDIHPSGAAVCVAAESHALFLYRLEAPGLPVDDVMLIE
eukprot:EG_transcript_14251